MLHQILLCNQILKHKKKHKDWKTSVLFMSKNCFFPRFRIGVIVEMQAEQILTGSRAGIYEKVGAESRADTKLLQFFAFFAVFMPFLYRYWNKRAVIVDQRAEQTSLIWGDFWAGLALSALLATLIRISALSVYIESVINKNWVRVTFHRNIMN